QANGTKHLAGSAQQERTFGLHDHPANAAVDEPTGRFDIATRGNADKLVGLLSRIDDVMNGVEDVGVIGLTAQPHGEGKVVGADDDAGQPVDGQDLIQVGESVDMFDLDEGDDGVVGLLNVGGGTAVTAELAGTARSEATDAERRIAAGG